MTALNETIMSELKKIAFKVKYWDGPMDTRHDAMATDVMLQTYFMSEELTGTYQSPPQEVTASYIPSEKAFFIGVPEALLEAFLDKYEADLTAPGESKKEFDILCGQGKVNYRLCPYEPFESTRGDKRSQDDDLWGFIRGEKKRTYRMEDMMNTLPAIFRKCGIDASNIRIAPQRNKLGGGITCIDSSFTVNGLSPIDTQGHYPVEYWAGYLVNIPIGSGYMSFECSRDLATRLGICNKCLRDSRACLGHGKAVGQRPTNSTETKEAKRDREIRAHMAAIKRAKQRRDASSAGSSSSGAGIDPSSNMSM